MFWRKHPLSEWESGKAFGYCLRCGVCTVFITLENGFCDTVKLSFIFHNQLSKGCFVHTFLPSSRGREILQESLKKN